MSELEAKIANKHGATKWSAEQKKDYEFINGRSRALGKRLKRDDFDKDGNAVGEWAKVLAELDAWAAKYKVKFRSTEHETGGGPSASGATPRTHTVCPGTTTSTETTNFEGGGHITIVNTCHLRRQTWLGRCVFDCVGEITSMHIV